MPNLHGRFPAYRHHKHSGQAIVTLNGVDHYLGPHGSQVSKSEYDRLIAEWIARGKRPAAASGGVQGTQASLNEIILAFWEHAQAYYRRPDGTPTSEIDNFRQAIRPFRKLYGATLAIEFGPKALKAVREQMIAMSWSRKNINKQIDRIRHILKWAASEELLPASVYEQLRTVPPLRRGRTEARETPRVMPASEAQINAVKPFVSGQVWALIQLQLLTGARPGELLRLRAIDLQTSDRIWTCQPQEHKTAYREMSKTIYFGPQAQAVLAPFLNGRPVDQCLFSPQEAESARREKLHARRRTPLSCGNRPGTNRSGSRLHSDHYTVDSYRQAIERACDLAFPPPAPLARQQKQGKRGLRWETVNEWQARLTPENQGELKQWQREHRWHPYQLRHNAATYIRREFGIEMARIILGHRSLSVTEIYAEADQEKARSVVQKLG